MEVVVYDGLLGTKLSFHLPKGSTVQHLKQAISEREDCEAKTIVLLCGPQPPASNCSLESILQQGCDEVFFYNRSRISNPNETPNWADLTTGVQQLPAVMLGKAVVETLTGNCACIYDAVVECEEQQAVQTKALEMALRNLTKTMLRDEGQFKEFAKNSRLIETELDSILPEFHNSILPLLRETAIHEEHQKVCGVSTLGQLLEDRETQQFNTYSQATEEWRQRKEELVSVHEQMYQESRTLLQQGQAIVTEQQQSQSRDLGVSSLVKHARTVLESAKALVPTQSDPGGRLTGFSVDASKLTLIDAKSHQLHSQSRHNQLSFYHQSVTLLRSLIQLQSHVRQVAVRRGAQTHVSGRLGEYIFHLKGLQRAPEFYEECIHEVASRVQYNTRIKELLGRFKKQQDEVVSLENERRQRFEHSVPRDLAANLFPALAIPPFIVDVGGHERVVDKTFPLPHIQIPSRGGGEEQDVLSQHSPQQQQETEATTESCEKGVVGKVEEDEMVGEEDNDDGEVLLMMPGHELAHAEKKIRELELALKQANKLTEEARATAASLTEENKSLKDKHNKSNDRLDRLLTESRAKINAILAEKEEILKSSQLSESVLGSHIEAAKRARKESDEQAKFAQTLNQKLDMSTQELARSNKLLADERAKIENQQNQINQFMEWKQKGGEFVEQVVKLGSELGIRPQTQPESEFVAASEVVNLMFVHAQEYRQVMTESNRPTPSLRLRLSTGSTKEGDVVVFQKSEKLGIFVAVGVCSFAPDHPVLSLLSAESVAELSTFVARASFIVGKVVQREIFQADAEKAKKLCIQEGKKFATLTVECLQVDDDVPSR